MYGKQDQGALSKNFVKQMAKQFEQISIESTSYASAHEANFKQCNWWLNMPSNITCFDDLIIDSPAQCDDESQINVDSNDNNMGLAIDGAEIANETVSTDEIDNDDKNHVQKTDFLRQVDKCLNLSIKSSSSDETIENSFNLDGTKVPQNEPSSDVNVNDTFYSLPCIVAPELREKSNWLNSLTSTISHSSISSNTSDHSSPSRASQTSFNSMSSVSSGQITNTVEELLYNEETYIKALNYGIYGYMKNFTRKEMPLALRGQQYRVFGNVNRIRDFHEHIFYPALRQCNMNIVKICNTFCDFIQKGYFYIYILYAINHQKSEKICIEHRDYFKQIQNEIGDKLGVNSFLVQPIQRLPKYKLLLGQLFSELSKELGKRLGVHDDSIKNELGACCLAEKRIQRLLDTLNGSMNINDIDGSELHTLCQGKFILVDRFDICEKSDLRRRYKGKVFLFEKCIIYTEQISSKNKLFYRGHFRHTTLGFTFEDQRNYFRLYNERKGNQEIEFMSDAKTIQLWIQMLNQTMFVVVQQEKKKIEENRRSLRSELSPLQLLLRNAMSASHDLALATIQTDSADSSSGESQRNTIDSNTDIISIKSSRSIDSQLSKRTSTWYTNDLYGDERKLIERFLNSEKYFIQLMKTTVTTYLIDLPDDICTNLETFLRAFRQITKFHTDTFHPKLLECEMKTISICDLIKTHLDKFDFNIYYKYAAYVHEALPLIRNFHLNSENNKPCDECSDIESLLLMPINHMANYAQFLDGLLNEYKSRDLLADDFKTIAAVEIEMKKLHKLITENYMLNSMKGTTVPVARKFGMVTYSDEISIDFTKCRILILEVGLVCVRTRLSTKTKKEKFVDQLFSIPILNIELHENDAYPRKMRIIADNATHVNYTVTFATTRKKKQFMDAIRTRRNSPSR